MAVFNLRARWRGRCSFIGGQTSLACAMLLWLVSGNLVNARADEYFDAALEKIEQTLVRPLDSYGLTLIDQYTLPGRSGPESIKQGYSFYTAGGKFRYGKDDYPAGASQSTPAVTHLLVSPGDGSDAQSITTAKGKRTLEVHVPASAVSIGQDDAYVFHPAAEKNASRPDKLPIQMLTNPCFAPLELTPLALRRQEIRRLADDGENRVYEFAIVDGTRTRTVRLYFSPQRNDALVKSQVVTTRRNERGETETVSEAVRSIDAWQRLPSGVSVPARFTLDRTQGGKNVMHLVREISGPVVGNVELALFDTERIPQFNERIDAKFDVERAIEEAQAQAAPPRQPVNLGRTLLIAANLALIVALVCYLVYRRWRRVPVPG